MENGSLEADDGVSGDLKFPWRYFPPHVKKFIHKGSLRLLLLSLWSASGRAFLNSLLLLLAFKQTGYVYGLGRRIHGVFVELEPFEPRNQLLVLLYFIGAFGNHGRFFYELGDISRTLERLVVFAASRVGEFAVALSMAEQLLAVMAENVFEFADRQIFASMWLQNR